MYQTALLLPALVAKKVSQSNALSTSTPDSITLEQNVTILRISVLDNAMYLKWGATTLTSSNYDIPLGVGINDIAVVSGQTVFQVMSDTTAARYRISQI
jgi:hypothetical protein